MRALIAAAIVAATATPAMAQWTPYRSMDSGYCSGGYCGQSNNSGMQFAPSQYLGQPGPAIRYDKGGSYCSTPNNPGWCIQR
jgi:hypothetical protein